MTLVTEAGLSPVAALRSWRLPGRLKYSDHRTAALFSRRRSRTVPRLRSSMVSLSSRLAISPLYNLRARRGASWPGTTAGAQPRGVFGTGAITAELVHHYAEQLAEFVARRTG